MNRRKIKRFEDMEVWQDALSFSVSIYSTTKKLPKEEVYGLASQMQRASSSISANIAEGFGRKSRKDTAHFYKIANGSLLETKNFIYLSERLGYISAGEELRLIEEAEGVQKQINAILGYFRKQDD